MDYDLQLTGYGNGHWRATFWKMGTTPPVLGAPAYEAAPWTAVQRAARAVVWAESVSRFPLRE